MDLKTCMLAHCHTWVLVSANTLGKPDTAAHPGFPQIRTLILRDLIRHPAIWHCIRFGVKLFVLLLIYRPTSCIFIMLNHLQDVWFKNTRQGVELLTLLVYKGKQEKPTDPARIGSKVWRILHFKHAQQTILQVRRLVIEVIPTRASSVIHTHPTGACAHTLARAVLMGRVNLHQLLLNSNLPLLPNVRYAANLTIHMLPLTTDYWSILFLCCSMEWKINYLFFYFLTVGNSPPFKCGDSPGSYKTENSQCLQCSW